MLVRPAFPENDNTNAAAEERLTIAASTGVMVGSHITLTGSDGVARSMVVTSMASTAEATLRPARWHERARQWFADLWWRLRYRIGWV